MTPELAERIRHLEILVSRRIEGLLQGDHRGFLPGAGREVGDARPYAPGDDVRRIDWNVTARAQRPFVRETIADHELETILVVDLSGSMAFGTAADKRDVAMAAAAVYGFVAAGAGNRVGAALATSDGIRWIPPASSRPHVYRILAALEQHRRGGEARLADALRQVQRVRRRRGLIVLISDFLDDGNWDRPIRSLSTRQDVVAIQVRDPLELRVPDLGVVRMEDAETGRQQWVDTADPEWRSSYEAAAAHRDARIRDRLRQAGATHVALDTDRDWVADLVRSVLVRRRLGAVAGRTA